LRCARRYARMLLFNTYIEKDVPCVVCNADRDNLIENVYLPQLLRSAKDLLRNMSIDEEDGVLQE